MSENAKDLHDALFDRLKDLIQHKSDATDRHLTHLLKGMHDTQIEIADLKTKFAVLEAQGDAGFTAKSGEIDRLDKAIKKQELRIDNIFKRVWTIVSSVIVAAVLAVGAAFIEFKN